MKKINIIKESREFDRIIQNIKPYKYKDYIIFVEKNENSIYKFGISVGKKVGNAVVRNKIKRRIKAIIDKKDYQNNFNCIIIVGRGINVKKYEEIENNLIYAFERLNILKENTHE